MRRRWRSQRRGWGGEGGGGNDGTGDNQKTKQESYNVNQWEGIANNFTMNAYL